MEDHAANALMSLIDKDPVVAIQEFWMANADLGIDLDARSIAEVIVDHQCARGDYDGCSPELEMAFSEYEGWATQAIGGRR